MAVIQSVVRLAVVGAVVVAAAVMAVTLVHDRDTDRVPPTALTARDGALLPMPTRAGVVPAAWKETPVLVFIVAAKELAGVEAMRGAGEATPSIALPGSPGLRVFALSAKSTHLGCTVSFVPALGASKDIPDYDGDGLPDGRLLDPCHHGQWDAFHRGSPQPATPAPARLAALNLSVQDGQLESSGFDGRVGPQR